MRDERRTGPRPTGITSPDTLPIETLDHGAHIVYGVDEADVRAVLQRLPPGTIDGLAGIQLSLARDEECAPDDGEPDPFTGRRSFQYVPGAWAISLLGVYHGDGASITLVGDVVDPTHPLRDVLVALQRIDALMVLLHELAHHVDVTTRVARGRWRADDWLKSEDYADTRMREWTRAVAVPYLEQRHGDELRSLLDWIERHGGVRLTLATLADEPTDVFTCGAAVRGLIENVLEDEDPLSTRAEFADDLWFCDLYDECGIVSDGVLAEVPGHRRALFTRIALLTSRNDHDAAGAILRELTEADPDDEMAWMRLAISDELRCDWTALLASATRLDELSDDDHAAELRARALLGLGRYDEMDADLARVDRPIGDVLRASQLLAAGQYPEALARAERLLESIDVPISDVPIPVFYPELLLVRHDAAVALGLPAEPLDDETLERLQRRGYLEGRPDLVDDDVGVVEDGEQ